MSPTSITLDGTWEFIPDPEDSFAVESLPQGSPITVPGSWEPQTPGRYGIVRAWYRRRIAIPPSWVGHAVILRFGAVMDRAEVWIDGRLVGRHQGGYSPFSVDVTGVALAGHEHDLVVRVVNPLNGLTEYPAQGPDGMLETQAGLPIAEIPHGKQTWYSSMSGIWQSVLMEALPEPAFERLGVVPDLAGEAVSVQWSLWRPADQATVELRVLDPQGHDVAHESVGLAPKARDGIVRIGVAAPQAWDVDAPNLYRLDAILSGASGSRHERSIRFGFRRIETRAGRLLLNGKPLFIRGALDQDVYPEGLSLTGDRPAFYRQQFRLVREMGLNLLRCHLKVPDPAYLDAADEAGILLWCELPNWTRFSERAAAAGRATLQSMVESMGHHPSIVIWTVINEDWGTDLNGESRDRHWLIETVEWLKRLDPTRLVVDNSACQGNFHLATDLADFHAYVSMPDDAIEWRNLVADFARRPPWLWSAHGDARGTGDEPLVMSEFGTWGLPDISRERPDAWWLSTGRSNQPGGAVDRFRASVLDRIWPDFTAMATATQWRQFEALQYQVGELRRHPAISGYVITEFTDAFWEANGLLDLARGPKAYQRRLPELTGPSMLIADIPQRDCWAGEPLPVTVTASSFSADADPPRVLAWKLWLAGEVRSVGSETIASWPVMGPAPLGTLHVDIPPVDRTALAALEIEAIDPSGRVWARGSWSLAIVPARRRETNRRRRLAVDDPQRAGGLEDRIRGLGHALVSLDNADVLITTELSSSSRRYAEDGGSVILLARSRSAIPGDVELARPVVMHARGLPSDGEAVAQNAWTGDWISVFSWIDPSTHRDLPAVNPLDFAYQEVFPDHVLLGYDPQRHGREVSAGMFAGWVHAPASLLWSFPQGRGSITITTLRLSPERGPVATVLLENLIQAQAPTLTLPR